MKNQIMYLSRIATVTAVIPAVLIAAGAAISAAEPSGAQDLTVIGRNITLTENPSGRTVVPVTLYPVSHRLGRPTIDIEFDCQKEAPANPYVVFDSYGPFAAYTYNTGDGKHLGEYWWPDDIMPSAVRHTTETGSRITELRGGKASAKHGSITFYCASDVVDANQATL